MVRPLRVIGECWPSNIWYESSGNGTLWQGNGMYKLRELQSRLPPLEVVADLSPSNATFESIQTLLDGRADVSPDTWGATYQRFKLVDFSHSQNIFGTYVYSGRSDNPALGNIFIGVFDPPSCVLFILSMLAMMATMHLYLRREKPGFAFAASATYMLGNCLDQPLCPAALPRQSFARSLVVYFAAYNVIVSIMYSSRIIAMLTNRAQAGEINSLEDLLRPCHEHLRVWVSEMSFVKEKLSGLKSYQALGDRVDLFRESADDNRTAERFESILASVLNGTHVIIQSEANLEAMMTKIYGRSGVCQPRTDDFRRSRDALFFTSSVWLYRSHL